MTTLDRFFPDDRQGTGARIWIEQDARVAYAYWFDAEGPVQADVWLYNLDPTPEAPPWQTGPRRIPFLNSREYVDRARHPSHVEFESLSVEWVRVGDEVRACIHLGGAPIASLARGEKPGRSRLVTRDGPLARKEQVGRP